MRPMAWVRMLAAAVALNLAAFICGATDSRLIDQFGHPLDAHELAGRWLLVYFGYTNCPEVCPAALTKMSAVLNSLGPAADSILPLFVSLNPHDSPAQLRDFASRFYPRLRALSGSPTAVADAAQTFGVPWQRGASTDYIDHGMLMYLANPDGRIVETFHPQQSVCELAGQIQSRLTEKTRR
jgi:cytochrome oxidase Cu insertion factor (SCO1/SenC/PrrC family)